MELDQSKKPIELKDLEADNKVWCGGYGGFCQSEVESVVKTSFKFDEKTGEKYKVIHLQGDRLFDSRNGAALTSPTAYFLKPTEQ